MLSVSVYKSNQRGHIIVDGGGRIITHPLETSDTYSVVAEGVMYTLIQALMVNIQGLKNWSLLGM